jgi:hypothetical protein
VNARKERVLNFLASNPDGSDVMVAADLREVLLFTGGTMMARGRLYDIVSKPLGAGVYRVSLRSRAALESRATEGKE